MPDFEALTDRVQTLAIRNAKVDALDDSNEKRRSKCLAIAGAALTVMMILVMAFGPWHITLRTASATNQPSTPHLAHR